MHRLLFALVLGMVVASPVAAKSRPVTSPPVQDGWPGSAAGAFGRAYVAAFNSGDEAMRKFYVDAFAPESLAVRGPEKRLARYHELRERVGSLTLDHVVKDSSGVVVVALVDADAGSHEFTFTTDSLPPHHLRAITLKQVMRTHGGLGGDFHH